MTSSTLSLRLPQLVRERLDRATRETRRSRAQIVTMALERHLEDLVIENGQPTAERAIAVLRSFAGKGVPAAGPRSAAEIDAHIRWLRDDD